MKAEKKRLRKEKKEADRLLAEASAAAAAVADVEDQEGGEDQKEHNETKREVNEEMGETDNDIEREGLVFTADSDALAELDRRMDLKEKERENLDINKNV